LFAVLDEAVNFTRGGVFAGASLSHGAVVFSFVLLVEGGGKRVDRIELVRTKMDVLEWVL
jgi:hypothetical protein